MKPSIKSLVLEYLEQNSPACIDKQELEAIRSAVSLNLNQQKPVSAQYLLEVLSETDLPIARSLGGLPPDLRHRVHFGDEDRAAESLLDLQREYRAAKSTGERERAADCRRAVLQAKERLKMVLRNPKLSAEKRREKEELLGWFLVWLENPEVFEPWLALRRRKQGPPPVEIE